MHDADTQTADLGNKRHRQGGQSRLPTAFGSCTTKLAQYGVGPVHRLLRDLWRVSASTPRIQTAHAAQFGLHVAAQRMMAANARIDLGKYGAIPVEPVEVAIEDQHGSLEARHQFDRIQCGTIAVQPPDDIKRRRFQIDRSGERCSVVAIIGRTRSSRAAAIVGIVHCR
ncbi:hypothetical protein NCPPB3923_00330 [Burkholderia glumae]|nr:hypothetical protein NCPPB3923_00330 [Burkholderia glumae]